MPRRPLPAPERTLEAVSAINLSEATASAHSHLNKPFQCPSLMESLLTAGARPFPTAASDKPKDLAAIVAVSRPSGVSKISGGEDATKAKL
jgi:hypothetical protein